MTKSKIKQNERIIAIKVKIGQPEREEIWELCKKNHSYCSVHGKCPDILDYVFGNGIEHTKSIGIEPMFYCHKCKIVKAINVWNNSIGIVEVVEELNSLPNIK